MKAYGGGGVHPRILSSILAAGECVSYTPPANLILRGGGGSCQSPIE